MQLWCLLERGEAGYPAGGVFPLAGPAVAVFSRVIVLPPDVDVAESSRRQQFQQFRYAPNPPVVPVRRIDFGAISESEPERQFGAVVHRGEVLLLPDHLEPLRLGNVRFFGKALGAAGHVDDQHAAVGEVSVGLPEVVQHFVAAAEYPVGKIECTADIRRTHAGCPGIRQVQYRPFGPGAQRLDVVPPAPFQRIGIDVETLAAVTGALAHPVGQGQGRAAEVLPEAPGLPPPTAAVEVLHQSDIGLGGLDRELIDSVPVGVFGQAGVR